MNGELLFEWQREEAAADVENLLHVRFKDPVVTDVEKTDVLTSRTDGCRSRRFGPRFAAQQCRQIDDGYFIERGGAD